MATELTEVVDAGLYDLDIIHRAAYALSDRCSASVTRRNASEYVIGFKSLDGRDVPDEVRPVFLKHLIDFSLRAQIRNETATIRDLIYRQAFVEADL